MLDRLQRTGLLAPPDEIDKVLETVVNNIEVTNNLDIQPEIHCRVLLTGTLESFSIGHTIVLSRGLLDVLPDEASLATMLAQELAQIIVTKPSTDQWGFNDTTNVSTVEALSHFSFRDTPADIQAANTKAVELLKNSPYKDKLGPATPVPEAARRGIRRFPALINPHLGNGVALASALAGTGSGAGARQARSDCGAADRRAREARSVERQRGAAEVQARCSAFGAREDALRSYAVHAVPDALSEAVPGSSADPAKADLAKKDQQQRSRQQ